MTVEILKDCVIQITRVAGPAIHSIARVNQIEVSRKAVPKMRVVSIILRRGTIETIDLPKDAPIARAGNTCGEAEKHIPRIVRESKCLRTHRLMRHVAHAERRAARQSGLIPAPDRVSLMSIGERLLLSPRKRASKFGRRRCELEAGTGGVKRSGNAYCQGQQSTYVQAAELF